MQQHFSAFFHFLFLAIDSRLLNKGVQSGIPVGTAPGRFRTKHFPIRFCRTLDVERSVMPCSLSWGFFENPSEQQRHPRSRSRRRSLPVPCMVQLTCVPSRRMKNLCRYVSVSGRVRFRSPDLHTRATSKQASNRAEEESQSDEGQR